MKGYPDALPNDPKILSKEHTNSRHHHCPSLANRYLSSSVAGRAYILSTERQYVASLGCWRCRNSLEYINRLAKNRGDY